MDKFLIKRKRVVEQCRSEPEVKSSPDVGSNNVQPEVRPSRIAGSGEKEDVNVDELEFDPALRRNIYEYGPNQIEKIRRAYMQRGPYQPKDHNFPQTQFGNGKRRFNPKWFDEHAKWLEYSIKEDSVYCLCCYLFKSKQATTRTRQSGAGSFVNTGFRNWKKKEKLSEHVGGPMSSHNQCLRASEDFMNHAQHIDVCLSKKARRSVS